MRTYLLNGILQVLPDSLSEFTMRLSWENSPLAEDPGSLTREQSKANPEEAYINNIEYNAGEAVTQGRIGLYYKSVLNINQEIRTNAYFTQRAFNNRLPFEEGGSVDLQRDYGGITWTCWEPLSWTRGGTSMKSNFYQPKKKNNY